MGYIQIDSDRLRDMLKKAIKALEDEAGIDTLLGTDLEEEIGITEEEYYEIMGW